MMLLVIAMVLAGVFDSASKEENRLVSATDPDDDAIYVNASPKETLPAEPQKTEVTTTTANTTNATTETDAAETERNALYYVTVSGNRIVLLDEYGEYLDTLNENANFLPKSDLAALRAGIALYSKDELSSLIDDLS